MFHSEANLLNSKISTAFGIHTGEEIMVGTFICSPTESVELMNICDGNKDCREGEDERFTLCKSERVLPSTNGVMSMQYSDYHL